VAEAVVAQPQPQPLDAGQLQLHCELRKQLAALGMQWQLYLIQKAAVDAVVTKIMTQSHTRLDA